ncbi:hypothetical protein GGP96_001718 [Salinibacter ruber]|nr:hypothetical protein [Salinibacter ruber]
MMTSSPYSILLGSGLGPSSVQGDRASVGRSIMHEGIAVTGRVPTVLRRSVRVLLLIAILAD